MSKQKEICKRCHRLRVVNEVRYCVACNEVLRKDEKPKKRYKPVENARPVDGILEIRKDTETLKLLSDLEELASVSPERGGHHFSDWERKFIADLREQQPVFSDEQRAKIKEIWHATDLRKRSRPDEKAANLFSNLSPARQIEQRERAAKIRLPWEK